MPDVYKGKPYMTEEYFENREIENTGSSLSGEEWVRASLAVAHRDKDMLKKVLHELELENQASSEE